MAEVSFRDVKKSYAAGVQVIHGVTMDVADGEFVVIVGPSGCGKSTLLRMVAGLERISGGEIAIGGRVVNNLEPKDRDIAMVFQNYALYPHMRVYDNMAYGLRIRGMTKADIDARVKRAAGILELGALLERRPRDFQGSAVRFSSSGDNCDPLCRRQQFQRQVERFTLLVGNRNTDSALV